jgi:asparagine synthase (glutamine-hydrolysing)
MCAIVGFWDPCPRAEARDRAQIVRAMASAVAHRGPDDDGAWADDAEPVALGHRRLAILDLTSEGHQPMISADGRFVLSFNGEIYNFKSLRGELKQRGHAFRGHSDTEVMLAAFCEWGLRPALERFTGMFAFALWDRLTRRLHLARDRAGEKPLYYGWTDGAFVFGSELTALRAHPCWRGEIDRSALALLTRFGYVPSPHCIYANIFKLPPANFLTMTAFDIRARLMPEPEAYWSSQTVAMAGAENPFRGSENEAREQLRGLLSQSVSRQMVADVPLGAFLSGGIDSSLVVALMQAQSGRPIKTFSIGFEEKPFDEAPFAKSVAAHLGTEHTELYVRDRELQQVIPKLPRIYDEPFADSSQIPTALLCRLTRASVTVSLSGDGGDELFGGYNHYRVGQRLWKMLMPVPHPFRATFSHQLRRAARAGLSLRLTGRANQLLNRLWNLSDILPDATDFALYQRLMSPNRAPSPWLKSDHEPAVPFGGSEAWKNLPELFQRMMWLDFSGYLPDDILVKVDRAAMAVSLETRIPLLDHRVIEFAFSLPTRFKRNGGEGKSLLRQMLYQYVPPALVDRPKKGFSVPLAGWLRGPMRDWAEALLDESRLRREEFFDARHVRQNWQEHLLRKRDWSPGLWHVLMFQAWLEQQGRIEPPGESGLGRESSRPGASETGDVVLRSIC